MFLTVFFYRITDTLLPFDLSILILDKLCMNLMSFIDIFFSFNKLVKGFGDQGKEDEEVRGGEPNKGVFISTNTTSIINIYNVVSGFFSTVLALSLAVRSQALSLSHLQDCGALF